MVRPLCVGTGLLFEIIEEKWLKTKWCYWVCAWISLQRVGSEKKYYSWPLCPNYFNDIKLTAVSRKAKYGCYTKITDNKCIKATVCFRWDWSGLPCLVQLLSWLHVSTTIIFGPLKDDSIWIDILTSIVLVTETSKMALTLYLDYVIVLFLFHFKCFLHVPTCV